MLRRRKFFSSGHLCIMYLCRFRKWFVAFPDFGGLLAGLLLLYPKGVSIFIRGKRGKSCCCLGMNLSKANISKLNFASCYYVNVLSFPAISFFFSNYFDLALTCKMHTSQAFSLNISLKDSCEIKQHKTISHLLIPTKKCVNTLSLLRIIVCTN